VSLTDNSQFKDYANASILIGPPAAPIYLRIFPLFSAFGLKPLKQTPRQVKAL